MNNDTLIINGAPVQWLPAPSDTTDRPVHRLEFSAEHPLFPQQRQNPHPPQPVTPDGVVGLVPYVGYLVNNSNQEVHCGSISVVDAMGSVYVVRFQMLQHPDPVLPIVGLNWPRDKGEFWRTMREAYATAAWSLANYQPPLKQRFLSSFNWSVQTLTGICSSAVQAGRMTQREYTYVSRHLIRALNNPEAYR